MFLYKCLLKKIFRCIEKDVWAQCKVKCDV